jgi:Uncharacterized conserved protein
VNKANKMADAYITDKNQKFSFMREVLKEILDTDYDRSAPLLEAKMTRLARQLTGIEDFFEMDKKQFNDWMLLLEKDVETLLLESEDPLFQAIKAALAGNIIDLSALDNVSFDLVKEIVFKTLEEQKLDHCLYLRLLHELQIAKSLLYIGDNAGEVVMDKLLIKQLRNQFPRLKITYVTRGKPISSDITEQDAYYVGIDKYAEISNNGTDLPGTDLLEVSETFHQKFKQADIIISKGQGNFETLAGSGKNIYYLFLCKCDLFVSKLKAKRFEPVFQAEVI